MKRVFFILLFCFFVSTAGFVHAENSENDEIHQLKTQIQTLQGQFEHMHKTYSEMIEKMQVRIEQLEQEKSTGQVKSYETAISDLKDKVAELETNQPSQPKTASGILGNFNPDISVIGDFVYHTINVEVGAQDNDFTFREAELAFSANVDSYARADVFVAIENEDGETEVALEEGYLTLLETPIDHLQGKFGKFRPAFGKANAYHLHNMPWTTYPKVIQDNLGEEGFSQEGVSLSYLLPNPWDIFSEATFQALDNGSTIFGSADEGESVYLAHSKNFFELNEAATLEVGGSYMLGDNGSGNGSKTDAAGADITMKWKSTQPGSHKAVTSQTEAVFVRKEVDESDDLDSWGMYSSLEHQFAQRWSTFGRFDYSQTPGADTESQGFSAGLTFAQSEYAFWRLQFTHTDNNLSEDSDEVWLQLNFGIGPHRAHTY